ncbi:sigma-54-dependent transcriptional regulator [Thioflexithrix psekupsensis]|uniref:Transcriptional regulator n=1 Tax=Thioflexithrix psekupsensis TaxID=1570016 RepID=A0A251X406_9GAMM|nr:sigma-54 dependent transcriptional regulator [Thioflexithrix psekupsensis]OUD12120.1 transcriptional regulator [Thioflexithrix psekupsensis]
MSNAHILVVDDEPDIRAIMQEILEDEGYQVSVAEHAEAARQIRREKRPDVILLDIWMPDTDGISLLKEWCDNGLINDCSVIMMSGHGTVETAVEATKLGAYDFIEKPVTTSKLLITLKRALEMASLQRENQGLKKRSPIVEPLGHSEVIQQLREQVKRLTQHKMSVLINGESGSGRTLFARYIHQQSLRRDGPFVNVRVAGMSPENQVLELFGVEGSPAPARLEQANRGTLYIKDIADMDDAVQSRLLNSLESQSFTRNGGSEAIPIDVRIIAATAYPIDKAVNNGRLREDLYYYLNIIPIHIPPLRDHCEDVPELLDFYVNVFVNQENLPYRKFSVAAQNRLRNYTWPGNVRELRNLVQRLLILGNGLSIEADEVEPILNIQRNNNQRATSIYDLPLREAREQFERDYLEHQLQEVDGNVSKVANRVGLERTHLYRKLRALDIDPKQTKK